MYSMNRLNGGHYVTLAGRQDQAGGEIEHPAVPGGEGYGHQDGLEHRSFLRKRGSHVPSIQTEPNSITDPGQKNKRISDQLFARAGWTTGTRNSRLTITK